MQIHIDGGNVTIEHEGRTLSVLSAQDALTLARALQGKRTQLQELASTYDCSECGQVHTIGVLCPTLKDVEKQIITSARVCFFGGIAQ